MENFNIGHLNIGETSGFNFISPWGDNSDRILKNLKTLSLQPTTINDQQFPVDTEYHWEGYVTAFKDRMPCGRDPRAENIQAKDMFDAPRNAHKLEGGAPESASAPWHDTACEMQGATVEDATWRTNHQAVNEQVDDGQKTAEYMLMTVKGKTAKIKVDYHELVRKCVMRIQNRLTAEKIKVDHHELVRKCAMRIQNRLCMPMTDTNNTGARQDESENKEESRETAFATAPDVRDVHQILIDRCLNFQDGIIMKMSIQQVISSWPQVTTEMGSQRQNTGHADLRHDDYKDYECKVHDETESQTTKAVYHEPVRTYTTKHRVCMQGYPGHLHTEQVHRSECIVNDPYSRSPLPVSCGEPALNGNVFNEPNLDRSLAPNSKAKCVQGWSSSRELGKQNIRVLRPDDTDISLVGGLNLDLGSEVFSSQLMSLRELIHEDHRYEFGIVNDVLYNTSRADGNTILYGHDITFRQDRGCRRPTGTTDDLLHTNPNENGQACATSPKRGIHTSGVSGVVSEGSIQTMILSQHGLPGTVLQGAGTAHLSETTGAERSRSHAMSKHDSIDSMIRLYGVQLYGILLGGLVVLSYMQLYYGR